jgi:hypothetical protein
MPEARNLTTFTQGLTDEQVADKERMLKEVLANDSSLCPTIAELCVDFCVRQPDEATRIRETREWESDAPWRCGAPPRLFMNRMSRVE